MKNSDLKVLEYMIRIGIALTFFGHGVLAIIGNPKWLGYIEFFGISTSLAETLMTVIGYIDVSVALFLIFKPYKPIIIWAIIWAFSTALIRPLTGESIWSFVERGVSWIAPIALYFLMCNRFVKKSIFTKS